jgi:AraC-like DNA-binding protein
MVGDRIAPLKPGDLVLVGSNLPHVWHQDKARDASPQAVDALVIQFAPDFLGAEFWRRPELRGVADLLARSARGLQVKGKTRGAAVRLMEQVFATTGVERLIGLLQILACLAASRELAPVASVGFRPTLERADQERMERVCRYIDTRLSEPIMRDACAAEAHLSAGAFSRFFRTRTGMTLPAYGSELRIGRACHLLGFTDEKITDIVFRCGFGHVANFNLCFRRQLGMTPREYRQRLRLGAAVPVDLT